MTDAGGRIRNMYPGAPIRRAAFSGRRFGRKSVVPVNAGAIGMVRFRLAPE